MCLMLTATTSALERPQLEAAAAEGRSAGFSIEVEHLSRWPWGRTKPARVTISESGGWACSLLGDNADWNAETWLMRPEVLEPLANTLEILSTHGPRELTIEALWMSDTIRETVHVTPAQLAALARSSKLGTHTRYVITHDAQD